MVNLNQMAISVLSAEKMTTTLESVAKTLLIPISEKKSIFRKGRL